ncbi:hypothetical protein VXE65_19315 [Mycolicibacterium conceptionense]|uniref:hypothetical protein n=1 Tax=Mycolicibacterium conceptionense TaxID=451644 RepID=UPI003204E761
MTSETLVSLEATTKDLLGRAASIRSLSGQDRAELNGLASQVAETRSAHESVIDTPIGERMYMRAMQGLIGQAHQILGKYRT